MRTPNSNVFGSENTFNFHSVPFMFHEIAPSKWNILKTTRQISYIFFGIGFKSHRNRSIHFRDMASFVINASAQCSAYTKLNCNRLFHHFNYYWCGPTSYQNELHVLQAFVLNFYFFSSFCLNHSFILSLRIFIVCFVDIFFLKSRRKKVKVESSMELAQQSIDKEMEKKICIVTFTFSNNSYNVDWTS